MKIIAVGDLHIGRTPSRLPDSLAERAEELGPVGTWRKVVEYAKAEKADAVVLAGDVVEEENDFFEAYRVLARGIGELINGGALVVGVAGNHDVRVLPRLADQIEGFNLLGRGGEWGKTTLRANGDALTLHGWSYAQKENRRSPLGDYSFSRGPGVNLGILHCDLDQSGGVYAPVASSELKAAGLDGWLLGHIHAPDKLFPDFPLGYLGSAVGLDPGEPGGRGPWMIEICQGEITAVNHSLLAPLHWDTIEVDLSEIDSGEDARDLLLMAIEKLGENLAARPSPPAAAGLRVVFTGYTNRRTEAESILEAEKEALKEIYTQSVNTCFFVERIIYSTRPRLYMLKLAERRDPPGLLARRLLLLEREEDDPDRRRLLDEARCQLAEQASKTKWRQLGETSLENDDSVVEWLRQAGFAALEKMLAQEGGI